jgi:beta-lactamase class A
MSKGHHHQDSEAHHPGSRQIRIIVVLPIVFVVALVTFLMTRAAYSPSAPDTGPKPHLNSEYQIKRLTEYKFIRPLLSAKPLKEYESYLPIKRSVSDLIQQYKNQGLVLSASLYMRDFDKADWTAINQNEKYSPGSILKIPILMTILKQDENHPGFLDDSLAFVFRFQYSAPKHQSIVSKQIQFGKKYTRRELAKYMIAYSDNNATEMLWMSMDKNIFATMFADFGLPRPDMNSSRIPLSAQEYSLFMESLFNATYLNIRQSEFAIELLTKSTFDDGIVKGIQSEKLLIAHKFGESGTDRNKELHETGLLYIDDRPYLITVMTRGNDNVDYSKLASVIQGISHQVYEGLTKRGR